MIYIFVPLYAEAVGLIKAGNMTPTEACAHLQCFANDEMFLTITGVGMSHMAAAVGAVCTKMNVKKGDIAVLYGSAAGIANAKISSLYVGARLYDVVSQRDGYPDLLTKTELPKAVVASMDRIYEPTCTLPDPHGLALLYDMESSAFMQACMLFLYTEQVCVLRFVSDDGSLQHPVVSLRELGAKHADEALRYMHHMVERIRYEEKEEWNLDELCKDLHASAAMQRHLYQIMHYCRCMGMDAAEVLQWIYAEHVLPCRDRQEGKKVLDAIEKKLCR